MTQRDLEREKQGKTGFYVVPIDLCEHFPISKKQFEVSKLDLNGIHCFQCSETKENWICVECGLVGCSRYVNSHMIKHSEESNHKVVVSLADFSCWCFECEAYMNGHELKEFLNKLHFQKFGVGLPGHQNLNNNSNKNNKNNNKSNPTGVIFDEEEIKEFEEPKEQLEKKAKQFAQMLKNSKKMVCYTGAGVSTASKLADYRSPKGIWTLKAKGEKFIPEISIEEAKPCFTHMALCKLWKEGKLEYIVSTNVDSLHLKSGIHPNSIAELHGNAFVERCIKCDECYLRPFDVTKSYRFDRFTGRLCSRILKEQNDENGKKENKENNKNEDNNSNEQKRCLGKLKDSIINFGENLPETELTNAIKHSMESDLRLILGTSMRVAPANKLPFEEMENGKKEICCSG